MYGKIFSSMYDGSLYGQWEAIVTFQQMIVLADAEGYVDMTPQALAARTSIPLDIIQKGIELLLSPDKYSRTPDCDGRRIELVDDSRPWGWRIVNHAKYRQMASAEEKREADKVRIALKRKAEREQSQSVAERRDLSPSVADVAHTDTDTNTKKIGHPPSAFDRFWAAYPKKAKKKDALKVWKAKRLDSLADRLLEDIKARLSGDRRWRGGFIPDPPVYLRGERWNDELEPDKGANGKVEMTRANPFHPDNIIVGSKAP